MAQFADTGQLIYVVDDDAGIAGMLEVNLKARGYRVELFSCGEEMLEGLATGRPDLIILDLIMDPGATGLEIATRVRQRSQVPILMLSVMQEVATKAEALNAGADDYLTKPFDVDELMARVRAILRRTTTHPSEAVCGHYHCGGLSIDLTGTVAAVDQQTVRLSRVEWAVLRVLVQNAGQVVLHRDLLQGAWGPDYGDESDYLRAYIARLRRKLEPDPSNPRYILLERGLGYRLAGPDQLSC